MYNEKDDLISIIVPIYHVEKYLENCIDSICGQTYRNLEIILVDDGSDDGCPQICDDYAKFDDRIIVVHKANGGLSDARNAGINIANGKYLAFIDSDDIVSNRYIEFLYRAIMDESAEIAQCDFVMFSNEKPKFDEQYLLPTVFDNKQMLENLYHSKRNVSTTVTWTKLYKTDLFSEVRFPLGKLHEDEFTSYKLIDMCNRIAYLDLKLYGYYNNSTGIIGSKLSSRRWDGIEALLDRYLYYQNRGYDCLLAGTANQIIQGFIRFGSPTLEVVDHKMFIKRGNNLFEQSKKIICFSSLARIYHIIFRLARTPRELYFLHSVYLSLGKVSKRLGVSQIRKKNAERKNKQKYIIECEKLFENYIPEKTVFIIGSIEYDNLGDHAIVYAQRKFIESNFPSYSVIEIRDKLYIKMRDWLKHKIYPESLITIPGGGNMGNIWFDDENRRRMIIEDFPDNKIIVFPQTIEYTSDEQGQKKLLESAKIYNRHKNIVLCAREKDSYNTMKSVYPDCTVVLVPDIVLSLNLDDIKKERHGALVCFRTDKERALTKVDAELIKSTLDKSYSCVEEISTIAPENVSYNSRKSYLLDLWMKIARSELLVTDRLHGMIFAYITNTPCVVLANLNHKIIGTYKAWLEDCDFIQFTDVEHFRENMEKIQEPTISFIKPNLIKEFDLLKRLFINE